MVLSQWEEQPALADITARSPARLRPTQPGSHSALGRQEGRREGPPTDSIVVVAGAPTKGPGAGHGGEDFGRFSSLLPEGNSSWGQRSSPHDPLAATGQDLGPPQPGGCVKARTLPQPRCRLHRRVFRAVLPAAGTGAFGVRGGVGLSFVAASFSDHEVLPTGKFERVLSLI